MKSFLAIIFLLANLHVWSQSYRVSGVLKDASDQSPLIGASVILFPVSDTSDKRGTISDNYGAFEIDAVLNGAYKIRVSYIGYTTAEKFVKVQDHNALVGEMKLQPGSTNLSDVNIVEKQIRVTQKGDTSEYNANAFKTNPDATAEDLIKKMPGITSENGTIKAQGEEVKKVLVDGKEFFGDDANLALKNLPAEVIDKVQVFDKMSDQAQFTKFDDGNSQKALNIVTKKGKSEGVFGKFYAGYGYLTDSRYTAGANINWMNGDKRLSFIGMLNNVNEQNFSTQDLMGVMGGGQALGRGHYSRNSPINNFLVGQQNGISTTGSIGLNYSDNWGKNVKVTGSYFFNSTSTHSYSDLNRQYFDKGDSSSVYKESNSSSSRNLNHRINLRVEYKLDSNNTIVFTPRLSLQQNKQNNTLSGVTSQSENIILSNTQSRYLSNSLGYNFSADLLYQHKFRVQGRTLSVNTSGSVNNKNGTNSQVSQSSYISGNDSTDLDQQSNTKSSSYSFSGKLAYTEPIGDIGILQFSYEPSYNKNQSNIATNNFDTLSEAYIVQDTLLSNRYDYDYMVQKAGIQYRIKTDKVNFMMGVNLQYALLNGERIFPVASNTRKAFESALPIAMLNYKFTKTSNLRLFYRASTSAPSMTQLQSVIDNSNPLLLSSGNVNLKQNYSHFLMLRYGLTNPETAQSFFAFISGNYVQNYIANSTFIAQRDTLLNNEIVLHAGSQFTQPVNLNGNLMVNSWFSYGLPLNKIKCNLNLNAGFSYSLTPGLINQQENLSNTYNISGGAVLSSNISEKVDFTLSYSANYNIVKNSLQKNSDNNYFYHTAGLKFNWNFWKGFVVNTTLQNVLYTGISQGYNQNYFLWNAELGYKFLKDRSLELKFGAYDMLNQNSGVSRTVTETYVEDSKNDVLKRYVLMTLTYTLRYYKK